MTLSITSSFFASEDDVVGNDDDDIDDAKKEELVIFNPVSPSMQSAIVFLLWILSYGSGDHIQHSVFKNRTSLPTLCDPDMSRTFQNKKKIGK